MKEIEQTDTDIEEVPSLLINLLIKELRKILSSQISLFAFVLPVEGPYQCCSPYTQATVGHKSFEHSHKHIQCLQSDFS